ncbi:MAG TPA: CPBP family intramembrane glutamic endopeptidase [Mycobacteriales bacterium]|nr:CPBP family intramembrane glutamic endopeptidase [Mycobacteriales bacterium]
MVGPVFRAPPGWPPPPPGWLPPEGWQPDPAWPPAPAGWQFYLPEAEHPPAAPVGASERIVLRREILVVLAFFPLPYIVSAVAGLAQALSGQSRARFPVVVAGHPVASAVLLALDLLAAFAPVLLIWYLLGRSGESLRAIGWDRTRPRSDAGWSLLLWPGTFVVNAVVGVWIVRTFPHAAFTLPTGHRLALVYLLPGLLAAANAGFVEEFVVTGYLLHRLEQLGVSRRRALAISVAVRTSYHVYYGISALVMVPLGLLFGGFWQRKGRLIPIVAAHALYDALLLGVAIGVTGH